MSGAERNLQRASTRKMFPFDDVIMMILLCFVLLRLYHQFLLNQHDSFIYIFPYMLYIVYNILCIFPIFQTHDYPIETWISNPMSSKVWDEITYPFPNFNGATVWEWMSNFIPYHVMNVMIYPCRDQTLTKLVKEVTVNEPQQNTNKCGPWA